MLMLTVKIRSSVDTLHAGPGPHPGKPHPRSYGTFPRVLGRYARDERVLSLETAVWKMTGLPAKRPTDCMPSTVSAGQAMCIIRAATWIHPCG